MMGEKNRSRNELEQMSHDVRFSILGTLTLTCGDRNVQVGSPKLRVLLATLLLSPNRAVPLTRLAMQLWGDTPPEDPRRAIQLYVTRLRAALDSSRDLLTTVPGGYQMTLNADQLDLLRFEERIDAALQSTDDEERVQWLHEALILWRGEPCEDVPFHDSHFAELSQLAERRLQFEEDYIDIQLRLGRHTDLVPRLRRLTAIAPLRERFWVQLMHTLQSMGRQAEALQTYALIAARLADELGVDPGEELRAAHQQVLAHDANSTASACAPTTTCPVVPRQLPPDTARFTGREVYLAELDKFASPRDDSARALRLITVDGAAGTGKTALVTHWAHTRCDQFPDGQLFVKLHAPQSPPPTPQDILGALLRALGQQPGDMPADLDERSATFRTITAGKRMLLVLDNVAESAQVLPLLPGPGNVVVVTSRHRLRALSSAHGAERIELDVLRHEEAIELLGRFVGRERLAAEPGGAAAVSDYCGHLPLALVLAADRLADVATVRELAQELASEDDRLDTFTTFADAQTDLLASLDSAYRNLKPDAARAFRLLSLWPGSRIGVPAAAALAGLRSRDARHLLNYLADTHHLRRVTPGQFALHGLLRLFARSKATELSGPERTAAIRRMLDWCLHSAVNAARVLGDDLPFRSVSRQPPAVAATFTSEAQAIIWFETELDNLGQAVRFSAQTGEYAHAWQIATTLNEFLERCAHQVDHTPLLRLALTAAKNDAGYLGEAQILALLAHNHLRLNRPGQALRLYQQHLAVLRQHNDTGLIGTAYGNIARALTRLGRTDAAIDHLRYALALHRRLGDRRAEARGLHLLADTHMRAGRPAKAVVYSQQALTIRGCIAERFDAALSHHQLGELQVALGNHEKAVVYLRTSLRLFQEAGRFDHEANIMTVLATALRHTDNRHGSGHLKRAVQNIAQHDVRPAASPHKQICNRG
ncbi:AfsR/SARP family transcriptional regulator [Amycolatopsis anabasis]|uniref:AfsR/SARP family transcriptional regulator n=1 Tax=Amycolatopsis anabasis TaxID=1840409 RepID=UPI00131AEE23|nr:AfsR/SARP family transcriptional regulator [Amycolatopsis anabasis]